MFQLELKNAYIGEVWTPTSNTIAYYPLEKDWNDYSWNWHNLTWLATPTYTTSWGTKKVVSLNGSNLWDINNLSWTYTDYTFSVWCKPTSTGTWQEIFDNLNWISWSWAWQVYMSFNGSSLEQANNRNFWYQYKQNWWTWSYYNVYWISSLDINIWYNLVITSTSNWIKMYINWTQVASNSISWIISLTAWKNSIWGRSNNTSSWGNTNFFNWYLSEFILENKTWTATQISDYYNSTKSKYWL